MACNCGKKKYAVTSVQARPDATQEEKAVASAAAAIANAGGSDRK